jgi:hypothetical protein
LTPAPPSPSCLRRASTSQNSNTRHRTGLNNGTQGSSHGGLVEGKASPPQSYDKDHCNEGWFQPPAQVQLTGPNQKQVGSPAHQPQPPSPLLWEPPIATTVHGGGRRVEHAAGGPIRHHGKGAAPSTIANAVTALPKEFGCQPAVAASNTNVRQPPKHPRGRSPPLPGLAPSP